MQYTLATILSVMILALPRVVLGDGFVPCNGLDCGYDDLLLLIDRIFQWLVIIAIPIATLLIAYAGILYVTAAGNTGRIATAHKVFRNAIIGFILVASSWLIVNLIVEALLNPGAGIQNPLAQ